jgi:hypothetical protein
MDRDDLLAILRDMNDDTLTCRVDGTLIDDDGDEWSPLSLKAAAAELAADLAKLIAWAKQAPKFPTE